MTEFVKIVFPLLVDDEGFPPISSEILNARKEGQGFVLDNTPFFVTGVALGDRVQATPILGELNKYTFERVLAASMRKTISVIFLDIGVKEVIYQELKQRGCYCEYGEFGNQGELQMLAVSVPVDCDYTTIAQYVAEFEDANLLSYAELAV